MNWQPLLVILSGRPVVAAAWLCLLVALFGADAVAGGVATIFATAVRWVEAIGADGVLALLRQVRVGGP